MDWTAPIDLYCERLGPGLWAEPVNALSNLAFIAASAYVLATLRRSGRRDMAVLALALLVAVIGIGSFLFHTFANGWSIIADVAPITLFIYAYLALALLRFFRLSWPMTGLVIVAFFVLNWPIEGLLSPLIAGSAAYVPALLAMLVIGGLLARSGHPAAHLLLLASGVFLVSLTLRTLDLPLCADLPVGTHWLWHSLNALMLAILLHAALVTRRGEWPHRRAGTLGARARQDGSGRPRPRLKSPPRSLNRVGSVTADSLGIAVLELAEVACVGSPDG